MPTKHQFAAAFCLAAAFSFLSAATPPALAQEPVADPTAADGEAMVDSPFFKVGWPKIKMPKFTWKPGLGGDAAAAPTGQPSENPVSQALDKVAASSKKASDGVRNAWGSAMGKLSSLGGGGQDTSRQTAKDEKPGFFARLFAPEEPRAPETMSEWLAQDRVGTTTR